MRFLVDGSNVLGARPDGWWRDRAGAIGRLAAELDAFAARGGHEVVAVFDGHAEIPPLRAADVRLASRSGRDAADDDLAALAAADPDPASLTVVTSDAGLARRVAQIRPRPPRVEGAGAFRARL